MKKYFVKHFCLIPPPYGGVTVFVKRLCLFLCGKNYLSGAFTSGEFIGIPDYFKKLFADSFPRHIRSYLGLMSFLKLLSVCKDYKILHNHTSLNTCFLTWLVHYVTKVPVVWTIHNQMIDKEISGLSSFDFYFFKSLIKDKSVQIITVNQKSRDLLMDLNLNFCNDILVMPAYIPPVPIGEYTDYLDKSLVHFIKEEGDCLLFYAESFTTYENKDIYGTNEIIQLFCRLSESNFDLKLIFCIASVNNNTLLKELQSNVPISIRNKVYWQLGPVSEMWPLLETSTVLIRPTCTDGDSIMVREALAFGLPVIASDVTQRPDGCIVYEYGNIDDLYIKTKSLLENPYRREFPQHNFADDMLNIYLKLLN